MATQPKIEVQISAKADQLSASLAKARKDIDGLPAMAQQASRKMGGLDLFGGGRSGASMFGLDRVEKQIGRLNGVAKLGLGGFGSAARMIPGLGLVAGAASVGGILDMVTSLAGAGVQLKNTAFLAGTSAAGLNSMRGAARLMGLSAETADQAMGGLNHTLQDAVFGRNSEAATWFKQTGINIGSMRDGAKSAEAVLPQVVDTLTRLAKTNPLAAERLAGVWGIPSAALPMLIRGRDALQANRQEIERLYGSMGGYLKASEDYTAAMGHMSMASERLGMTVMTRLAPHLTPMLEDLSKWVDRHDKDIGDTFDRIGKAAEGVHWSEVGAGVEGVGKAISFATQNADLLTRGFETLAGTTVIRAILGNTALGKFLVGGLVAHEALSAADPKDKVGSWIDRNVPGAAAVDDWAARNLGIGRTYQDQIEAGGPIPTTPRRTAYRHFPGDTGRAQPTFDTTLSPQARGLLDTIAGTESGGRYDVTYGGGRLADYSNAPAPSHVITSGPNAGLTTSAFGRYQFLNPTWDDATRALGLTDKSPASQDRAGWWLAQRDYSRRTGRSLVDDLQSNDPAVRGGVGRALHRTWTSLPGGIEAGTNDTRFTSALDANTQREQRSVALPRVPGLFAPAQTAPQGGDNGQSTVRIDINHTNAPAGVTMTPSVQGNGAEIGGIRVRRAMPEAGMAPAFGGT